MISSIIFASWLGVGLVTHQTDVEFLGFAEGGRLAAFEEFFTHQHLDQPIRDVYSIIKFVDCAGQSVLKNFRGDRFTRHNASGTAVRVSVAAFGYDNPDWQNARPHGEWHALKKRLRFVSKKLTMDEGIVRIAADDDIRLTASATNEAITVSNPFGPVGYQLVARRADGALTYFNPIRIGRPGERVQARVRVYFDPRGYTVAAVHSFDVEGENGVYRVAVPEVRRLSGAPLGTYQIGALNRTGEHLHSNGRLFRGMHPRYGELYERYVGDGW